MKRTIDIMTTARAKGAELPAEWWGRRQSCPKCKGDNLRLIFNSTEYRCRTCGSKWRDKHLERNGAEFFCGPDLERAENLHHAFTVADALAENGVELACRWEMDESGDMYREHTCDIYADQQVFTGTAPERHLALIAACEAALGIQHEKGNT